MKSADIYVRVRDKGRAYGCVGPLRGAVDLESQDFLARFSRLRSECSHDRLAGDAVIDIQISAVMGVDDVWCDCTFDGFDCLDDRQQGNAVKSIVGKIKKTVNDGPEVFAGCQGRLCTLSGLCGIGAAGIDAVSEKENVDNIPIGGVACNGSPHAEDFVIGVCGYH